MEKYIDMSARMSSVGKEGHSKYFRFYRKVEQLWNQSVKSDIFMNSVGHSYERINDLSIDDIFDELDQMIASLAGELKCNKPQTRVSGEKIFFSRKDADMLERIFIQMIRNTLSHAQKNHIEIYVAPKFHGGGKTTIVYRDNGRGLDLNSLRKIGLEKNLIDQAAEDNEVAYLIFESGITTKETVNRVSGRGVGMDIIKKDLEENSFQIKLSFISPADEAGFRSFEFVIECPQKALKIA